MRTETHTTFPSGQRIGKCTRTPASHFHYCRRKNNIFFNLGKRYCVIELMMNEVKQPKVFLLLSFFALDCIFGCSFGCRSKSFPFRQNECIHFNRIPIIIILILCGYRFLGAKKKRANDTAAPKNGSVHTNHLEPLITYKHRH